MAVAGSSETVTQDLPKCLAPRGFAAIHTAGMTSLSVLVPVYNEHHLVAASLTRLDVLETSPHLEQIQVIVVDD